FFFFSSRRRHTRFDCDWSSDVCSSDLAFPLKRFRRLGYTHAALNGQKGYHGVAVLSRLPFERVAIDNYCGKQDCRHIAVTLGEKIGRASCRERVGSLGVGGW